MKKSTKETLLEAGLRLLLRHGYNDLGVQTLLNEAGVPKGSFYHHFQSKEDFALQVIDSYMSGVHQGLDACLGQDHAPPVTRIRMFFSAVEDSYRTEGYLGCMLGALGQELSGVNPVFREKIEGCFSYIASRLADCLALAVKSGDLPAHADPMAMANLLVDCWEGAALRSRLHHDPAPLGAMLDFFFAAAKSRQ